MGQIKIYGVKENLNDIKERLSDIIHACVVEAFQYPADKRFHRFFPLDRENFYFSEGRSDSYTVIEISIFEGRSVEAKKKLIRLLFERIEKKLNISSNDIEITIFETPKHNWGIRGFCGDELKLNYKTKIWSDMMTNCCNTILYKITITVVWSWIIYLKLVSV